jgi:uroporphyrinogen III methyltransferase/synthase
MNQSNGKVYLIGAGPGDPGLITVKGLNCIRNADVVIYDYLASPSLLAEASPRAEIIYVGKKGGDHTLSQDKINVLIAEKAKEGNIVARLKGGDPFIFGRGGEEAEVLIREGIAFEVVPGVTSAIAAPAYAGIPLTHREFTSTLSLVTGHEDPDKTSSSINWSCLAAGAGTLVFLMGVKNLPQIVHQLVLHGRSSQTPVALVQWGTTSRQRTVTGTLETIVDRVTAAELSSPAIIVVGEVVTLRDRLKWFETRPLFGKTIVVTRAREQASDLVTALTDLGAECLEFPTIQVVPPDNWSALDAALDGLSSYDWVIFTSVNGVKYFFERLFARGSDVRSLGHIRTAAIGPVTAQHLRRLGLNTDILPESFRAESVVEAFRAESIAGKRILLPRAMEARAVLPDELSKMGAVVDEVTVYQTRQVHGRADALIRLLEGRQVDMVTFTSSSTVTNFMALLPSERAAELLKGVTLASIGPITSSTAETLGLDIQITASIYTIPGLCEAILQFYGNAS